MKRVTFTKLKKYNTKYLLPTWYITLNRTWGPSGRGCYDYKTLVIAFLVYRIKIKFSIKKLHS